MTWPLSQDYNEAIQDPRNSFSDAELKKGEAVANALGIPMPRSGNFADVYEVRCPSGSRWAVKCFTREVFGLQERYAEIGKYLHLSKLPFMVDFQYLEKGIRVRGQWYPILKMQWVEGFLLNEFVRDNLDKKPILQALAHLWLKMSRRLRESYIAHCDLQHGNVLFVPGSSAGSLAIKLIDYDGMCVPSLAGTKSGEVGHPAYQHPERLRTGAYDQEVDRFSLLSVATALRCLSMGGRSLWERYDTGDNLLFRQSDFQAPADSPLVQELLSIDDPQTRKLVTELVRSCQGPLDAVPLLSDLLPEEKPAAKVTKTVAAAPASSAVAPQGAGAKGPDWDFAGEEASASVVKKRQASRGMPKWAWGAMGGAAVVVLLCVGVGVGLMMRNGPAEKEGTPVARNVAEKKNRNPAPKPPPPDVKPPLKPVDPPANPANPPPTPAPVEKMFALSPKPGRLFVLSPAGDSLAVSDEGDKTWRLVNPRTKKLIREFVGHEEPIAKLAFSFDGARAVTLGGEKMLRLWDLQTGKMIGARTVEGGPVIGLAISADGKGVLTADLGRNVTLWNLEEGKKVSWSNDFRKACCVACSPNSRFFVSGYDKSAKEQDGVLFLTHLVTGVKSRSFIGDASSRVTALAVSGDGKYIASGQSGEKCLVSLWEAATGKLVWRMDMNVSAPSTIHQVAFSPEGSVVLAAFGPHLRAWRVPSGQNAPGFSRSAAELVSGGFSPDSTQLLCASRNRDRLHFNSAPVSGAFVVNPPPAGWQAEGWQRIDPDHDCKFKEASGKLTIAVPAKSHVLDHIGMNSPRLLREVEGDFTAQVRVQGDFTFGPTAASTNGAKQPWLGAGLLLWVNDNTFLRLELAALNERKPSIRYANWEVREDGKFKDVKHNYPSMRLGQAYLRLERHGKQILASYSENGQSWSDVKPLDIELPAKVKIGVLAGSYTSRTFAPSFDQFQLKQGQGEVAGAVAVNPPRRPRRNRLSNRMAVPDAATLEDKKKEMQVTYGDDKKTMSKRKMAARLFEDSQRQGDWPLRYAMLNESCDLAAQDGDLTAALRAVSRLGANFDIDPLEVKARVLEKTLPTIPARDKAAFRTLTEKALLFVDRAVIDESFDRGERLLAIARTAATKADMSKLLGKMIDQEAKQFKALRDEYDAVKRFVDKLKTEPDDADANLAVGRYCCFLRGDWDTGLPLLIRGGDKALSELAQKDVAEPADAAARAAVADAWASWADKRIGNEQEACRRRAYFWYEGSLEALDKKEHKERAHVNARLKKLKSQMPELQRPFSDLDTGIITVNRSTRLLRLPPQHRIATRQLYNGPIDIRVKAVLTKNYIRITFLNGGELVLHAEGRNTRERFYSPYGNDPDGQGFGPNTYSVSFQPGGLNQIRILVTADSWTFWVNDKLVGNQNGSRGFAFASSPVRVWSDDGEVEIQSLVVKRVR